MMKHLIIWLYGRLPLTRRMRSALIWLLSPKFTVGVVGLVQDDQNRVLLLKHTYRRKQPWGLPGGGLRLGESLEECVQREILEETGMKVEVTRMLSAGVHPDRRLVDAIFSCRPRSGQDLSLFQPNAEISEAAFFAPDNLPHDISKSLRGLISIALRQVAGEQVIYQPESKQEP